MNVIEELYENTTGVMATDMKNQKKMEYICELKKCNPSKGDLMGMMQRVREEIIYYQSPEAKRDGNKFWLKAMAMGFLGLNILFWVMAGPVLIAMRVDDVLIGPEFFYVVVAAEFGALVCFALAYLAGSAGVEDEIRRKLSDLTIAMMAMTEYEMREYGPLRDGGEAPA